MTVRICAFVLVRLLLAAFVGQFVLSFFVELPYRHWLALGALVGAVGIQVALARTAPRHAAGDTPEPVEVDPPMAGRWLALNSPADKVPSHGTHQLGQTYAIDAVAEPEGTERPGFRWLWPIARRNSAFPAFDAPLYAVADATVVHAEDRQRDHLSRNSLLGLLYLMLIESDVRGLTAARRITGNHLVLDLGGGTYAMYAHLRRGSLTVRAGDRVTAGQVLARCGNSGNSTEPHLHFQLMDGPDLNTARGVPFRWRGVGVPAGGEPFTVPEPVRV
ncbi:M23 family metallopeptidase [Streptomyces purpureus]|uniref:Peptidase n=1 Tax=Streptomyces purpureus TaxID=1951 RepID=A0A918HE57_9ACTN|nr:M23 family metallopeptidase [Streptomyces purpureus]GGT54510.1 peptidase [Streptomyces purpureus]